MCMRQDAGGAQSLNEQQRSLACRSMDLRDAPQLRGALDSVDAVVHTAGPYLGEQPDVLEVRPVAPFTAGFVSLLGGWDVHCVCYLALRLSGSIVRCNCCQHSYWRSRWSVASCSHHSENACDALYDMPPLQL